MTRPSWNEYFKKITELAAARSPCLRRQVGALIVKDKNILTTGYNGPPRNLPHCQEAGCLRNKLKIPSGERHELCRGLHAEQNAIIQAARHGVSIQGADLYTLNEPCIICTKMIINAGIKRVFYWQFYNDKLAREIMNKAEVKKIKLVEGDTSLQFAIERDRPL